MIHRLRIISLIIRLAPFKGATRGYKNFSAGMPERAQKGKQVISRGEGFLKIIMVDYRMRYLAVEKFQFLTFRIIPIRQFSSPTR